ncbi:MAG: hypothetical protein K8S99_10245 [Planctomycetes bacterium]|nr:hypothetical protein [Planctomycetota bacterium]
MATEVVRMVCPNLKCRALLTAPVAARGKVVRCRKCGTKVHIPETAPVKTDAANDAKTV